MPQTVSAEDMRRHIMHIEDAGGDYVFGNVHVSREDLVNGYAWDIAFVSAVGDVSALKATAGSLVSASSCSACLSLTVEKTVRGQREHGEAEAKVVQLTADSLGNDAPTGLVRVRVGGSSWTPYIPVDATGAEIEALVSALPQVASVAVTVSPISTLGTICDDCGDGYQWTFAFTPVRAEVGLLEVDIAQMDGESAQVTIFNPDGVVDSVTAVPECADCVEQEMPVAFDSVLLPQTQTSYRVEGLVAGHTYVARVTAVNDMGSGTVAEAVCAPSTASFCAGANLINLPLQAPGAPENVLVDVQPGISSELLVSYDAPSSDGGSAILKYRIEWSELSTFQTASSMEVTCDAGRALHVISVATSTSDPSGITGGTFQLNLIRSGSVASTTLPIRFDATALREQEIADTESGIFCDPLTNLPCDQSVVANGGSIQSQLEYLPDLSQVEVSRFGANGEFTWFITFHDDGSDYDLTVADNSLVDSSGTSVATSITIDTRAVGQSAAVLDCTGTQVLTGLVQGLPYYVRVFAYNQEGYSLASNAHNPAGANSQAPMRAPGLPTAAALTVVSGSQLRVTWSPPVNNGGDAITSYKVELATDVLFTTDVAISSLDYIVDSGPYTKVLSGLQQGTRYYVRISAMNSQGYSAAQVPTPPYETPRQLPGAPLTVNLEVTSDSMLTVAWETPLSNGGSDVTQYMIEWDTDMEFEGMLGLPHRSSVVVDSAVDMSYTIRDLSAGMQYYVRVRAGNQVGFSAPTRANPNAAVPSYQVPGTPRGIALANDPLVDPNVSAGGKILVTFEAPLVPAHGLPCGGYGSGFAAASACPSGLGVNSQADGGRPITAYQVQWSTYSDFRDTMSSGGTAVVPVPSGDVGPYSIELPATGAPLLSGTQYFVRVAAMNSRGIGPYCEQSGPECEAGVLSATPSA
jgi:hypothetical protein